MKTNKIKTAGMIALLVAVIITIAIFGFSCVGGMAPIGWSGGAVSGDMLFVGSLEGRLVSVNMTDQSILRADMLQLPQQSGLFGCSAVSGCAGGTSRVSIYSTPAVSGDLVYVAGYNGKIYAYKSSNLAQRWIFPREGYLQAFVGGMVITDNKLIIGCSDGNVYSLDATTGDLLYQYKTEDKIWGTPTVDGDTVYIGSFDKNLYALNVADLSLKWKFTSEGSIIAKPLVVNGTIYIGSFDRNLYALNAADGTLKWKFMAQNWFWSQPVLVGDTLYSGCLDGFIYVLKAATGDMVDRYEIGSPVASQPIIIENYLVFVSHNGGVFKIDLDSKDIVQIAAFETTIDGPLAVNEGIVYIQTSDASLQRIDPINNSLLPSIPLIIQ